MRSVRALSNAAIDLRYGLPLAGEVAIRFADRGAKETTNSDYRALEQIFTGRIRPDQVLVDVDCGKGRVINWWLRRRYRSRAADISLADRSRGSH